MAIQKQHEQKQVGEWWEHLGTVKSTVGWGAGELVIKLKRQLGGSRILKVKKRNLA